MRTWSERSSSAPSSSSSPTWRSPAFWPQQITTCASPCTPWAFSLRSYAPGLSRRNGSTWSSGWKHRWLYSTSFSMRCLTYPSSMRASWRQTLSFSDQQVARKTWSNLCRGSQRERPGAAHCSVQRMGAHRPHSAGARTAELCFQCGALHRPGGRARWLSTSRRNARYRSLGHRAWSPGGPARENLRGVRAARRSRRQRTTWAWPGTGDRPEALRSDGVADEVRNQRSAGALASV